jgi:hypothetical protein
LNDEDYRIIAFEVCLLLFKIRYLTFSASLLQAKEENGDVLLKLPESRLLDEVIGTSKWMVKGATKELSSSSKRIEIVGPSADVIGAASFIPNEVTAVAATALDW